MLPARGVSGGVATPTSDYWTEIVGLPAARKYQVAGVLSNKLYAIGGDSGSSPYLTTNVYAFDGTAWTEVAGLPVAHVYAAADTLGNKIYAMGGSPGNTNVFAFDGTTWTEVASLPAGRGYQTTGVLSNRLYMVAGSDAADVVTTNVYEYTP